MNRICCGGTLTAKVSFVQTGSVDFLTTDVLWICLSLPWYMCMTLMYGSEVPFESTPLRPRAPAIVRVTSPVISVEFNGW